MGYVRAGSASPRACSPAASSLYRAHRSRARSPAAEESPHRAYRIPRLPRDHRQINVPQRLFLMPHVTLFFEHAQLGADRRVRGRIGKRIQDFLRAGASAFVQNVHDLSFAAA